MSMTVLSSLCIWVLYWWIIIHPMGIYHQIISIYVHCPHCHQAKQIIIDVGFMRNIIRIYIPEVLATCLYPLTFLTSKDHLYNIFISISSKFLQPVLHIICNLSAQWVEIIGRIILFGKNLFLENILDDLSRLGGFKFLTMLGFDLILVGGVGGFFRH